MSHTWIKPLAVAVASLFALASSLPRSTAAAGEITYVEKPAHLIFRTVDQYRPFENNTNIPPDIFDMGGNPEVNDWLGTLSAYIWGLLPSWDFIEIHHWAVLSTPTVDARDRIALQDVALVDVLGNVIVNDIGDFWEGELLNPADVNPLGQHAVSGERVWTGTHADGTATDYTLDGWSTQNGYGTYGDVTATTGGSFLENGTQVGTNFGYLYIISKDPWGTVMVPVPEPASAMLAIAGVLTLLAFHKLGRRARINA